MATQIEVRRDTTANWMQANPVLGSGEPAYDSVLKQLRIGDGVTKYLDLPALSGVDAAFISSLLLNDASVKSAVTKAAASVVSTNVRLTAYATFGPIGVGNTAADTATLLAALAAAKTAGCDVELPAGSFNFSQTITLPLINDQKAVGLVGAGKLKTQMVWTDLGSGQYALRREDNTAIARWLLRGISFRSNVNSRALGVAPVQMDGIEVSRRLVAQDCITQFFKTGWLFNGDHNYLQNVESSNNFYGIGFRQNLTQGDISLIDCGLDGNTMASVGIMAGGKFDAVSMLRGHVGFSPYGIYSESGAFAASPNAIAQDAKFWGTSWEACGNGHIYQEGGDGNENWGAFTFYGCGNFSRIDDYRLAAKPTTAIFKVGVVTGWIFDNTTIQAGTSNGFDAMFAGQLTDSEMRGSMTRTMEAYLAAGKRFFKSGSYAAGFTFGGSARAGEVLKATEAVTRGQLLEYVGTDAVKPNTGNGLLVGVAYNDAAAGEGVMVITRARLSSVFTSTTLGVNERLVVDPNNPTRVVSYSSAPTSKVVGALWFGNLTTTPPAGGTLIDARIQI